MTEIIPQDKPEEILKSAQDQNCSNSTNCTGERYNVENKIVKAMVENDTTSEEDLNMFSDDDTVAATNNIIDRYNWIVARRSEEAYIRIVSNVVEKSSSSLNELRDDKKNLRNSFVNLFKGLIMAQLIGLAFILMFKGFCPYFNVADNIILTFMTTVFVETMGVITLMILFAFKSDEEIKIIDILNSVVGNYQKFSISNKTNKDK